MENPRMEGGQVVPMDNEMFLLGRGGISFTAKSGRHTFHGSGQLLLSPLRLVFHADESSGSGGWFGGSRANLAAFDIPLATLFEESFSQPIFGANNLSGTSPPLDGSVCEQDIRWCFTFKEGGVGTFLPIFFGLLHEMRSRLDAEQRGDTAGAPPVAVAVPATVVAAIVRAAYVDPADPTKLYVQQEPAVPLTMGKKVE